MGDDGLFGPGSVTWRVHLEPVLWVGGFRALLLQSLHPRVMRGTYQNSALFDPAKAWSRFQRTVEFVGVRTFGSTAEVERAGARVRRLHAALRGYDPDTGYTFRIDHPDHLLWVHATEVDSYAHVARRAGLLDDEGVDAYLAESVRAARVIGLADAPSSAARDARVPGVRPSGAEAHRRGADGGRAPPHPAAHRAAARPAGDPDDRGAVGGDAPPLGPAALRAARAADHRPVDHRHAAGPPERHGLLPDLPAPPNVERARRLVRAGARISA